MTRHGERPDPRVEGNLRRAYRAPPDGPQPHELSRLLARLEEALDRLETPPEAQESKPRH